jgi:hypothetical protein
MMNSSHYRLIHISLFLFLAGLIVFLYNLNHTLAHILLCVTILGLLVYVLLTILPVFYPDCPYKTPLTAIPSYIKYIIADYRSRRRGTGAAHDQSHSERQSEYLATRWDGHGNTQGADLDHTALRWTLLALTDSKDIEEFMGALPSLLQSDSGTSLTRDGARAAQALLFGQDVLGAHLARLLHSSVPPELLRPADRQQLNTLVPAQADRQRLDTRAATCLNVIALLSRSCKGPMLDEPLQWAITYFNPVVRDALALRAHTVLAPLAQSTTLLLAWHALVVYRAFLEDISELATDFKTETHMLWSRLNAGNFLARALFDVLRGLSGEDEGDDDDDDDSGGMPLANARDALIFGAVRTYRQGANPHGPGSAAGAREALARAAQEDLIMAKKCLAVLFMHAACLLPAGDAGKDTLRALAAPLEWRELCEYSDPVRARLLLVELRQTHGLTPLSQSQSDDAQAVIDLYLSIHDPIRQRAENRDAGGDDPSDFMIRRRRVARGTI